MPLFLITLAEPSEVHTVEKVEDGFLIRPQPGRYADFQELARGCINRDLPAVVLPHSDGRGGYEGVHVIMALPAGGGEPPAS